MVRLDIDYNLVSPHFYSYNFFMVTIVIINERFELEIFKDLFLCLKYVSLF